MEGNISFSMSPGDKLPVEGQHTPRSIAAGDFQQDGFNDTAP